MDNTYKADDTILATVTFRESVYVTGTPQVTLTIGSASKKADYIGGATTASLLFRYTVVSGDTDTDGISIETDQLSLNGGTIKDLAGNAATLTHTALGAQPSHTVDTTPPTIVEDGISLTSTTVNFINDTYRIGDTIQATVTFSEKMAVTGTPQVT